MRTASELHVVACKSNLLRWETGDRHPRRFIEHMLDSGVSLTFVETQFGDRPFAFADFSKHIRYIGTRANTPAWSKESAINVGIKALPDDAKYVAWIDTDIEFRRKDWAIETVEQLQIMPVVQPWSEALDLGPKGEVMSVNRRYVQTSFGWVWVERGDVLNWRGKQPTGENYPFPHPGYAWAARMDFLNDVGLLLDFSVLGSADHQMAFGMLGHADHVIRGLSTPSYQLHVKAWCDRAYRACQGHVGYVAGRIEHQFHGEKSKRKYIERQEILRRHGFDPLTDLHRNRYGIVELSDNGKPQFYRDCWAYMSQRDEDANCRQE
jgi:hypothetical protein